MREATHALTVDTVSPGSLGPMQDIARLEAQADTRARQMVGCWTSEFGQLNQLYRLWRLEGQDASTLCLARPDFLQHRRDRLLAERRPTLQVNAGPYFYELRTYKLRPERVDDFMRLLLSHFELRETWSKAVGLWATLDGDLSEVVHLWFYRDLAHRARTRAAAAADTVWDAYRRQVLPMLTAQSSVLLSPTTFSPLR